MTVINARNKVNDNNVRVTLLEFITVFAAAAAVVVL